MKARQLILIAAAVVLVLSCFFLMKFMSGMKVKPPKSNQKVEKVVQTIQVYNKEVPLNVVLTGRLVAREKIEVFSEVTGKMLSSGTEFKEGVSFQKGQTLIQLDNQETRLTVTSERSNFLNQLTQVLPDLKLDFPYRFKVWESFANQVDPTKALPELPEVKELKERNFLSGRNLFSQYYSIKSQEARLAKFTLSAPFDGVLSQSMVNPGTLVRSGQKLGEFINPSSFELEAAINIREAAFVTVGDTVALSSPDISGNWTGTVKRLSRSIDPNTQTLKVYISVVESQLKEGLYLRANIQAGSAEKALELPRNLLVENNGVYVVSNNTLHLQPVTVIKFNEDRMVVQGLPDGSWLLNERISSPYEGQPVAPTNSSAAKQGESSTKEG